MTDYLIRRFIMSKVAIAHHVQIVDVSIHRDYPKSVGMNEEAFRNASWLIGSSEIVLGIYDDDDCKVMSFFHEIGHLMVTAQFMKCVAHDKQKIEAEAWRLGLELAATHGLEFGNSAYDWMKAQIASYQP